jgi:protein-S-isoprenylcysteine O-methyltransferase Ste14
MNRTKIIGNSAIILYFAICFEILIMISPFAGFFYSIFNPVLLEIAKYPSTKWLSAFFLPHMVVPPNTLLKCIRIMGSVLFACGMAIFLICAVQVYARKVFRKGAVLKGFYSVIRHPQYLGLGIAGIGLSILWPRFLVAVLWLVMIVLYYFLAKDEGKRMLKDYPDTYGEYMKHTGMFAPSRVEHIFPRVHGLAKAGLFLLFSICIIGGAFFLRSYTINHLPLWTDDNVSALAIIPDDMMKIEHRMPDILKMEQIRSQIQAEDHYLVYFLPPNYVMQGMIADTGGEWKLYKQHHAISMITDWIFHPFKHLTETHHFSHGMSEPLPPEAGGVVRRLIFLRVEDVPMRKPSDIFSINARRIPVFMADVEIHSLTLLDFKVLPQDTGWGKVPTPIF